MTTQNLYNQCLKYILQFTGSAFEYISLPNLPGKKKIPLKGKKVYQNYAYDIK